MVQRWPEKFERLLEHLDHTDRLSAPIAHLPRAPMADTSSEGGELSEGESLGEATWLRPPLELSSAAVATAAVTAAAAVAAAAAEDSIYGKPAGIWAQRRSSLGKVSSAGYVVNQFEKWRRSGRLHTELLRLERLDLCESRALMKASLTRDEQLSLQHDLVEGAMALLCLSDSLRVVHVQVYMHMYGLTRAIWSRPCQLSPACLLTSS